MNAITDINQLIRELKPELHEERLVYVKAAGLDVINRFENIENLLQQCFAVVNEEEAVTLVLRKELADKAQLDSTQVFKRIVLKVHSSLEAVGLTAAVSTALAEKEVSANMIAGYYHDHILIPEKDATRALDILNELSRCARAAAD